MRIAIEAIKLKIGQQYASAVTSPIYPSTVHVLLNRYRSVSINRCWQKNKNKKKHVQQFLENGLSS